MFNRNSQGSTRKANISKTQSFRGPNKGLIKAQSLGMGPDGGAEYVQNIWPTLEGGRVRGGSVTRATLNGPVKHLTTYETNVRKLFAADATKIYDVTTPASPTIPPAAVVSGMTSGDWSSSQFVGGGATWLTLVNGADFMQRYDGTSWVQITAASTPAITGLATNLLTQIWTFKKRQWFVQKQSLSAWYLPVLAGSGALTEFPLGSVFSLGGNLLFGGTWSLDSGAGLRAVCIFVTDKGEIAVYDGIDPATDMVLVGVYRIGIPLHKNAHFSAGGDNAILTEEGIIAVSTAVQTDRAALPTKAITAPINDYWRDVVANRAGLSTPFNCVLWPSQSVLIIGTPQVVGANAKALVSNSITGAWDGNTTGWDIACSAIFKNRFFFGSSDNKIREGDVGGLDGTAPYQAVYIPSYNDKGDRSQKAALHARITARTSYPYSFQMFCNSDYSSNIPTPLAADIFTVNTFWDVALWDAPSSIWGGGEISKNVISTWQTISSVGYSLSPGFSMTVGQVVKPDIELLHIDLVYERGALIA